MYSSLFAWIFTGLWYNLPHEKTTLQIGSVAVLGVIGLGFVLNLWGRPLIGDPQAGEFEDRCVVATQGSGRPCKVSDAACTAAHVFLVYTGPGFL